MKATRSHYFFVITSIAINLSSGASARSVPPVQYDPTCQNIGRRRFGGVAQRGQPTLIDVGGQSFHRIRTASDGGGATLVARGKSFLTYLSLEVCSAVLYLEPHASHRVVAHMPPSSTSRCPSIGLEISYHKPVRRTDFQWATTHYTAKNGHTAPHLTTLLREFNDLYRDVKCGDRYFLEYNPRRGGGMSLSLNGKKLGTVGRGSPHERELAAAIYSIWFGERPFFERLKRDLLTPMDESMIGSGA